MNRRALLLGSSVIVASRAQAQPIPVISDTVPPRVDVGPLAAPVASGPPGATLSLNFMSSGSLDPRLTFTRASTATYFDNTGAIQTAAINAPRWDYDPVTHAPRGLLIEEARTNLLLNSATLGTQSVTTTAVATTLSFYGTGTVTLTGTSTAGPLTGTGAFPTRVSLTFTPTAGTLTLTVTGSVLSAQLEAGGFNTSWIPTTAAAVTRGVDACIMTAANIPGGWYSGPGGSWYAEFINLTSPITTGRRVIAVGPVATSSTPAYINPAGLFSQFDGTALSTAGSITTGAISKGASTWAVGASKICLNAGAVATAATLTIGYQFATYGMYFLTNTVMPSESMTGYMRRATYWQRILTNAEMQSVTT